eukprot:4748269-Prymnesium_polylepis.1
MRSGRTGSRRMHSAPWRRSRTQPTLQVLGTRSPTCLRKMAADKPAKIPQKKGRVPPYRGSDRTTAVGWGAPRLAAARRAVSAHRRPTARPPWLGGVK